MFYFLLNLTTKFTKFTKFKLSQKYAKIVICATNHLKKH